jgi:prepilin-type N-terminal cleavage/methylation domain-containing protein
MLLRSNAQSDICFGRFFIFQTPLILRRKFLYRRLKPILKNGFTLIELMVVVAIVGLLAAVALPAYQTYLVRARMAATLAQITPVKVEYQEYYGIKGALPTSFFNGTNTSKINPGTKDEFDVYFRVGYYPGAYTDISGGLFFVVIPKSYLGMNVSSTSYNDYTFYYLSVVLDRASGGLLWQCKASPLIQSIDLSTVPGANASGIAGRIDNQYRPSTCQ